MRSGTILSLAILVEQGRWRRLALRGSAWRAKATSVRLGAKPRKRLTEYPLQGMKIIALQLAK